MTSHLHLDIWAKEGDNTMPFAIRAGIEKNLGEREKQTGDITTFTWMSRPGFIGGSNIRIIATIRKNGRRRAETALNGRFE